jgi:hypothetical protein
LFIRKVGDLPTSDPTKATISSRQPKPVINQSLSGENQNGDERSKNIDDFIKAAQQMTGNGSASHLGRLRLAYRKFYRRRLFNFDTMQCKIPLQFAVSNPIYGCQPPPRAL